MSRSCLRGDVMNGYRSRNGDAFVRLRNDDLENGHRVLVIEELEQHQTVQ
jgi:hypothetical protein